MDAPPPPLPTPDRYTEFFWQGANEGRLLILRCNSCGTYIHLPRPVCRSCQSFDLAPAEVSGRGTVYSFTETFRPFHPYFVDKVPYLLATIELVEQPGLMLLSNLVEVSGADARIGTPVEVTYRALSEAQSIPVFRPVAGASEVAA
jgi:uncharacterized protein